VSLIKRAADVERLFKQRSFVLDSPGVRAERLRDGRVMIHARQSRAAAFAPPAPPPGQVTTRGSILNNSTLERQDFGLNVWYKIPDDETITAVGQFNASMDPHWPGYFEAGNYNDGFIISPNSFDTGDPTGDTTFLQVFGLRTDLTDWHFSMRGIGTGAQATVDVSTGEFHFFLNIAGFTYTVDVTYRPGG
jgi:hypothetical protein